jgi:hypothetical protein
MGGSARGSGRFTASLSQLERLPDGRYPVWWFCPGPGSGSGRACRCRLGGSWRPPRGVGGRNAVVAGRLPGRRSRSDREQVRWFWRSISVEAERPVAGGGPMAGLDDFEAVFRALSRWCSGLSPRGSVSRSPRTWRRRRSRRHIAGGPRSILDAGRRGRGYMGSRSTWCGATGGRNSSCCFRSTLPHAGMEARRLRSCPRVTAWAWVSHLLGHAAGTKTASHPSPAAFVAGRPTHLVTPMCQH